MPLVDTILDFLDERERTVLERRYGLRSGQVETLQAIGFDLGITEEGVRQVALRRFERIRRNRLRIPDWQAFADSVHAYLSERGGIADGDELLSRCSRYVDLERSQSSMAMAFLASVAGLIVDRPKSDSEKWLAYSSKHDRHLAERVRYFVVGRRAARTKSLSLNASQIRLVLGLGICWQEALSDFRDCIARTVGPARVMRLGDLMSSLRGDPKVPEQIRGRIADHTIAQLIDSEYLAGLQLVGDFAVVEGSDYERMIVGTWVTAGLPPRGRDLVPAMLYSGVEPLCAGDSLSARQSAGVPSSFITRYVHERTGRILTERALIEYCRRYPLVFARLGPRSWSLAGAGSVAAENGTTSSKKEEEESNPLGMGITVEREKRLLTHASARDVSQGG